MGDAAATVYRGFSDGFVADGVVTAQERRKLDTLARLLEIGADRVVIKGGIVAGEPR